jgi:transcriptional regulator with XRE-family HTH domain
MLSREDFAEKYVISRSLIERAKRGMPVYFLTYLRIADIYHIPIWQLFEGIE